MAEVEVHGGANDGDIRFFSLKFLFREYVALESYRCQFALKFCRCYLIDIFVYTIPSQFLHDRVIVLTQCGAS